MANPLTVLRRSIRAKLIAGTMAIVLAITCVLTYVISRNAATLLAQEANTQLTQLLNQSRAILTGFLEVRETNLDFWLTDPLVHSVVNDPALGAVFLPGLQSFFADYSDKEPWIENIYLIKDDTAIYAHAEPSLFSAAGEPQKTAKALLALAPEGLSVLTIDRTDREHGMIAFKRQLLEEGEPIAGGFIILTLSLQAVQQALFDELKAGQHGFIALTARLSNTPEVLWIPEQPVDTPERHDFVAAHGQGLLHADSPTPYRSILFNRRAVGDLPLAVVGIAALRDVREPVNRMITVSVGVGVLALLAGVLGALLFAGQLTAPIRQLTAKARQFAASERQIETQQDALVVIKSRDEIGELATTYNQMAVDIRSLDPRTGRA